MNIFISCARKYLDLAEAVSAYLEQLGHKTWFDHAFSSRHNRSKWWERILDETRRCDVFLFILATQTLESQICRVQLTYAFGLHKRILFLMADHVDIDHLPLAFLEHPVLDYRLKNTKRKAELANAIDALPPAPPLPDMLPFAPTMPTSVRGSFGFRLSLPSLSYARQKTILREIKVLFLDERYAEIADILRQQLIGLWNRHDIHPRIKIDIETLLDRINVPTLTLKVEPRAYGYNPLFATFSPDGRYILTGSGYSPPQLWDAQTGEKVHQLRKHGASVLKMAFSPDGQYLLTNGHHHEAVLWDIANDHAIRSFVGHISEVCDVAFSPDGKYALTCCSGGVDDPARLWDVATGKEMGQFFGDRNGVFSIAFSPDGHYLFTGNYNVARLWNVATQQEVQHFSDHVNGVTGVAFSLDGKYMLTASYMTAYLWDINTGMKLRQFEYEQLTRNVAFSSDNQHIIVGNPDRTVSVWDIVTGQEQRKLTWFADFVSSVGFSPDGRTLVAGSQDGTVKLWTL
jgi:hypothetical protein